jgi:hypothetical protein
MGCHHETAIAARDFCPLLEDAIEDLMQCWDCYLDMKDGASEEDRWAAKETLKEMYLEWDGSIPTEEEQEDFADRYDARLKKVYRDYVEERACEERAD